MTEPSGGKMMGELVLRLRYTDEAWRDDDMPLALDSGTKPTHEVNRAYLHYIIDCWLDEIPVELQPSQF